MTEWTLCRANDPDLLGLADRHYSRTSRGLMVFRVTPAKMPSPLAPNGSMPLWEGDPFYVQPSQR